MYREQTWLEVKRLRAKGMPIPKIARICGMSRNTVYRLLKLRQPPLFAGPRAKLTAAVVSPVAEGLRGSVDVVASNQLLSARGDSRPALHASSACCMETPVIPVRPGCL